MYHYLIRILYFVLIFILEYLLTLSLLFLSNTGQNILFCYGMRQGFYGIDRRGLGMEYKIFSMGSRPYARLFVRVFVRHASPQRSFEKLDYLLSFDYGSSNTTREEKCFVQNRIQRRNCHVDVRLLPSRRHLLIPLHTLLLFLKLRLWASPSYPALEIEGGGGRRGPATFMYTRFIFVHEGGLPFRAQTSNTPLLCEVVLGQLQASNAQCLWNQALRRCSRSPSASPIFSFTLPCCCSYFYWEGPPRTAKRSNMFLKHPGSSKESLLRLLSFLLLRSHGIGNPSRHGSSEARDG